MIEWLVYFNVYYIFFYKSLISLFLFHFLIGYIFRRPSSAIILFENYIELNQGFNYNLSSFDRGKYPKKLKNLHSNEKQGQKLRILENITLKAYNGHFA